MFRGSRRYPSSGPVFLMRLTQASPVRVGLVFATYGVFGFVAT